MESINSLHNLTNSTNKKEKIESLFSHDFYSISSLIEQKTEKITAIHDLGLAPVEKIEFVEPKTYLMQEKVAEEIKNSVSEFVGIFKNLTGTGKVGFAFSLPILWFSLSTISSIGIIFVMEFMLNISQGLNPSMYSIFSSKPLTLGADTSRVIEEDSRAARIDQVFAKYDCPLYGLGSTFVEEADKNDIPFWLVAAVSFQESSCGKQIPYKNGVHSNNAWGWAVYGDNVKMFDNWEHGIKVVSKYMSDNFYSKGITEPCVIMKTYTPPSQGSWCRGVEFFGDIIENYESP